MKNTLTILFSLCCLFSCTTDDKKKAGSKELTKPLFTQVKSELTGITFNNVITETDSVNPITYQYIYNGSGVATGDINNDGLVDLFFGANQESCRLYLNKGGFKFDDITQKAGVNTTNWCTGVTMADVNADGFLDIYVSCAGKFTEPNGRANLLFINNKNLTFTESAAAYGIADKGYSGQSTFFDYDRDGDLDLFVLNQPIAINFLIEQKNKRNNLITPYTSSHFYRNNGNNTFEDVSKQTGIESNAFSLSCSVGDLNNDGWPDMYVCNDYTMSDFLYINNKHGSFTDENTKCLKHTCQFSMGSDIEDFNNDGFPDILQADMLPEDNFRQKMMLGPNNYDKYYFLVNNGYGHQLMQNCLQLNNGNGTFSDIAAFAGVEKTDWTWATLFADFDNDGWKDIFYDNGYFRDYTNMDHMMYRANLMQKNKGIMPKPLEVVKSMPSTLLKNYIYKNNGNLTFQNVTDAWGLEVKSFSNGAVYADIDNDGDLDLVINNLNSEATVYKNNAEQSAENNYLSFICHGDAKNPQGIGTTITIYTPSGKQVFTVMPVRGYYSAVDCRVHFGLGKEAQIDSAHVVWPDGKTQTLLNPKANQFLTVQYVDAKTDFRINGSNNENVFEDRSESPDVNFRHEENGFIDFKREPLLPQLYSRMGPGLAGGDVNKDGRDDFYVGGAQGQAGCLYIQTKNGGFSKSTQAVFVSDRNYEDVAALFFDADGDGDPDLYVVSGGSEETGSSANYQDRLYLNTGSGNFQKTTLPIINSSGSCITSGDFDGDGDLDLFRGGRVSPGNYPFHPQSYLLQNDHGHFKDVTTALAPGLAYIGMVTSACWTDFDKDKSLDLILAGEWMPVTVYKNVKGKFKNETASAGLEYSNGWWNSLVPADFDNDGDEDLVAGNFGLNSRIRSTLYLPACVYAKDFDANGSTDAFICHFYSDSTVYPMYARDEMVDQVRILRKTVPSYNSFANMTMDKVFTADELKNAYIGKAYTFNSSYFENNGNGIFTMKSLPLEAQISAVNAVLCRDFNHDGFKDALLAGNNYSLTPTQGRMDASTGLLLAGDGKGNFKPVRSINSGFFADKDAKTMVLLQSAENHPLVVVGNNNEKLQIFRIK